MGLVCKCLGLVVRLLKLCGTGWDLFRGLNRTCVVTIGHVCDLFSHKSMMFMCAEQLLVLRVSRTVLDSWWRRLDLFTHILINVWECVV